MEWWETTPLPVNVLYADWNNYLLGFVRINQDGEQWIDESVCLDPPNPLDLEIPEDAVEIMVADRLTGLVDFWELLRDE